MPRPPAALPASMAGPVPHAGTRRWLLLVHQLPASPSNLRVRTWRRLQLLHEALPQELSQAAAAVNVGVGEDELHAVRDGELDGGVSYRGRAVGRRSSRAAAGGGVRSIRLSYGLPVAAGAA